MLERRSFKRILLKLSGEALMGSFSFGLDPKTLNYIAEEIATLQRSGVQVAVVAHLDGRARDGGAQGLLDVGRGDAQAPCSVFAAALPGGRLLSSSARWRDT